MFMMTPWVRRLLVANIAIFFLSTTIMPYLFRDFVLIPTLLWQRPWTGISYMFLHGGLTHLLFNMLGLFFFGPRLEQRLGGPDFLKLYFAAGFGGAAFSFFFEPGAAVVGASGAVYGILLAFAFYYPRERIYIWGILPIEAWLLVTLAVGFSVYAGFGGSGGTTAHFAHLGGLVFAWVYLKWREWRRGSARRSFQQKLEATPGAGMSDRAQLSRWRSIEVERLHEINREEVRHLLEKVEVVGASGLTAGERQFLDRMAGA
ncbi:MAG: rhomboid family intramembrane serine protease [Gemmatimonadetes bacterium]|nr:rhomboid family intramembrane serine protease [Gemmatimonadota bacterium]NNF37720.1 rhomboid family intramembrane serine protease [Gemmatimonadota bacterium]NNK62893.1 rhomboid family intramembrane serine protease [Gemmatimonadota bacterium]